MGRVRDAGGVGAGRPGAVAWGVGSRDASADEVSLARKGGGREGGRTYCPRVPKLDAVIPFSSR